MRILLGSKKKIYTISPRRSRCDKGMDTKPILNMKNATQGVEMGFYEKDKTIAIELSEDVKTIEVTAPKPKPKPFVHFYRSIMYKLRAKKFETDIIGKMEYQLAVQQKAEGEPCTTFPSVLARILFQCVFSWIALLMQIGLGGMGIAAFLKKKDITFTCPERKTLARGETLGVKSFWAMERQRQ